jgi:hypothetical protein
VSSGQLLGFDRTQSVGLKAFEMYMSLNFMSSNMDTPPRTPKA